MAGLGVLIWGVVFGGSAIGAAIDNAKMMKEPYRYLDDGTPIYLDRKCNQHINGEKVVHKAARDTDGNIKILDVGERSGRVYLDPEQEKRKKLCNADEKNKREAIENGMLSYLKYDFNRKKRITCEISTGKYIAQLRRKADGTCWKYYLPNYREYHELCSPADGDPGIEITYEEFKKLNYFPQGTHIVLDYYKK